MVWSVIRESRKDTKRGIISGLDINSHDWTSCRETSRILIHASQGSICSHKVVELAPPPAAISAIHRGRNIERGYGFSMDTRSFPQRPWKAISPRLEVTGLNFNHRCKSFLPLQMKCEISHGKGSTRLRPRSSSFLQCCWKVPDEQCSTGKEVFKGIQSSRNH